MGVTTPRLLIVCRANECRSVMAAQVFARSELAGVIAMATAGSETIPGNHACPEAMHNNPSRHIPIQLDAEVLASADLVLTMEKSQRAQAAQLLPASREYAFTLREAAALVPIVTKALAGSPGEFQIRPPQSIEVGSTRAVFKWLVGELDAARGYQDIAEYDIADTHGPGSVSHPAALSQISASLARVNTLLGQVLGADFQISAGR